jgi:hypothetical protein
MVRVEWTRKDIYPNEDPASVPTDDPTIRCGTRDPVRAAQVRSRHLFFLLTRQKLQTLIQDSTLFPGHTIRHACPKAEEPSPSRFAVNHVSGLFCNGSAKYAQRSNPQSQLQGLPRLPRFRSFPFLSGVLCRTYGAQSVAVINPGLPAWAISGTGPPGLDSNIHIHLALGLPGTSQMP